jgi:hypothetical protein
MGEDQPTMHTEDVELDEADAEAVVGGIAVKHMTMEQAFKEGYEQIASMRNGALMKNMKTGREIIVTDR